MTTTTTHPDVPLPGGTFLLNDDENWEAFGGDYRLIWGESRPVESSTNISVQPVAAQMLDGSVPIEGYSEYSQPMVHVDELSNGVSCERLTVTMAGARGLAAALLKAADEIDGWAAK